MPYRYETGEKYVNEKTAGLPPIKKEVFDGQRENFGRFFNMSDGRPVLSQEQLISWDDLEDAFAGGTEHAVKFFHGIGDNHYKLAVQVIVMIEDPEDPANYYALYEGPFYEVIAGKLYETDMHLWFAAYRIPYFANVKVMRGGVGSPPDALRTSDMQYPDPGAVILPWEQEVGILKRDNEKGGFVKYHLEVACCAEVHGNSDGGPSGYRHGLSMVIHGEKADGTKERMLKAGQAVSTYRYNAADLGHLCPPRCKKYDRSQLKAVAKSTTGPRKR